MVSQEGVWSVFSGGALLSYARLEQATTVNPYRVGNYKKIPGRSRMI